MKKETSKLIKEVRDLVTKKEGEMILFYLSGTYFFLVDHGLNEIPVDEATILLSYENPNIKIVYFDILPEWDSITKEFCGPSDVPAILGTGYKVVLVDSESVAMEYMRKISEGGIISMWTVKVAENRPGIYVVYNPDL